MNDFDLRKYLFERKLEKQVDENRALMPNASPETLGRDVEQSDKEYIATRQKRDKIAQDLYKKSYKELDHIKKDKVNRKLPEQSLKETETSVEWKDVANILQRALSDVNSHDQYAYANPEDIQQILDNLMQDMSGIISNM